MVSDYGTIGGLTAGFKMTVNGSAQFLDKVVLGTLANFPRGFPAAYKLFVEGGIITPKVKIALTSSDKWADFVFEKNYKLNTLEQVEQYISKNGHLPEVPSTAEVRKNGIDVAEMDALLLQKIEELTLYVIEMKKENKELRKEVDALKH